MDYFIPYKNGGGTIVDWDFTNPIHCFNWFTNKLGYTQAKTPRPNPKNFYMHRLLLGFPQYVDHINGNKNDNRMSNLRSVTHRKNHNNRKEHRNGKLVGAIRDLSCNNRWKSVVQINGKNIIIGRYNTEIEAHVAYIMYIRGV